MVIIFCGMVKVSTVTLNTSEFIRDNSKIKISFALKPFDFRIESKNYIFYLNENVFKKILIINSK
jgi:hypothetical protein